MSVLLIIMHNFHIQSAVLMEKRKNNTYQLKAINIDENMNNIFDVEFSLTRTKIS